MMRSLREQDFRYLKGRGNLQKPGKTSQELLPIQTTVPKPMSSLGSSPPAFPSTGLRSSMPWDGPQDWCSLQNSSHTERGCQRILTKGTGESNPHISGGALKRCVWPVPCFPNLSTLFRCSSRINSMCVLETPAPSPTFPCRHLKHSHSNQRHIPEGGENGREKEDKPRLKKNLTTSKLPTGVLVKLPLPFELTSGTWPA